MCFSIYTPSESSNIYTKSREYRMHDLYRDNRLKEYQIFLQEDMENFTTLSSFKVGAPIKILIHGFGSNYQQLYPTNLKDGGYFVIKNPNCN
jgi:hypothetical protein